jgi:hypothetical protein
MYTKRFRNHEISFRHDGLFNVWRYSYWPDAYLDADPEANARYLKGTGGWRVSGWQIVHVADTARDAHNWIYNNVPHVP